MKSTLVILESINVTKNIKFVINLKRHWMNRTLVYKTEVEPVLRSTTCKDVNKEVNILFVLLL